MMVMELASCATKEPKRCLHSFYFSNPFQKGSLFFKTCLLYLLNKKEITQQLLYIFKAVPLYRQM